MAIFPFPFRLPCVCFPHVFFNKYILSVELLGASLCAALVGPNLVVPPEVVVSVRTASSKMIFYNLEKCIQKAEVYCGEMLG